MITPLTLPSPTLTPVKTDSFSAPRRNKAVNPQFGRELPDLFIPKSVYSPDLQKMIDQLTAKYAHLKGKNVLLLYSGGLDTSFLTKFFSHEVKANVYTISFDVGEDQREQSKIAERAKKLGAVTHLHKDLKEKFANERCAEAIIANALYNDSHPLSSSLSRPLMSETAIDLAKEHGCVGVIHGSSPWQNNAPRFNNALASLSKTIVPITPVLDNDIPRNKEDEYLRHFGVIIRAGEDKIYSADYNLWAPEAEDGILQKINRAAGENLFRITKSPKLALENIQFLDIEFEKGLPIRYTLHSEEYAQENPDTPHTLAGQVSKRLLTLIPELNQIGGDHGIGRYDALEHRPAGFKEREVHEAPAATMIIQAKKDLERCVLDQETLDLQAIMTRKWIRKVCEGDWYHPLTRNLSKSLEEMSQRVNGVVRLELGKGSSRPVARASEYSLDSHNVQANKAFSTTQHPNGSYFTWRGADGIFSRRTEKAKL